MAQRKGLHSVLEIPVVYEAVQKLFTHEETVRAWFQMIGDHENRVILDVGCGPGVDAQSFGKSKKYIGIDISNIYIDSARKNYGDMGEFYCLSVEQIEDIPVEEIDIVILKGVFHHLSDDIVSGFLEKIKKKLSPGGRIFSIDPTYMVGRVISNFIVSLDRGLFVRQETDLLALVSQHVSVESKKTITQGFPPYQRILMHLSA